MAELTRSPSTNMGQWASGSNAYSSDNNRAVETADLQWHQYGGYDIEANLPEEDIDIIKVEVGIEFYVSAVATQSVQIRISCDGGATWSGWSVGFAVGTEELIWADVTAYKGWKRSDLENANWLIQIRYRSSYPGGGCPLKEAWTAYLDWIPTRITYMAKIPHSRAKADYHAGTVKASHDPTALMADHDTKALAEYEAGEARSSYFAGQLKAWKDE